MTSVTVASLGSLGWVKRFYDGVEEGKDGWTLDYGEIHVTDTVKAVRLEDKSLLKINLVCSYSMR